jgi:hypothetical protein
MLLWKGDAAYTAMSLQILDHEADMYKNLQAHQYHGSVYGVLPAKRGYLKLVGEWNVQEVYVEGPKTKVILNGATILDGDLKEARKKELWMVKIIRVASGIKACRLLRPRI